MNGTTLLSNIKRVAITLFLCVFSVAQAKEIKIQNNTSYPVTLELAHFYTLAYLDRSPTISTVSLAPDESTKLSVKPYDYASDLYIPNTEWVNAGNKEESADRRTRVKTKYSFRTPTPEDLGYDYYNARITAQGNKSLHIDIEDLHLGNIIQKMPETPEDNPSNGLYIWHDESTRLPFIRAIGGTESWEYKGIPEK